MLSPVFRVLFATVLWTGVGVVGVVVALQSQAQVPHWVGIGAATTVASCWLVCAMSAGGGGFEGAVRIWDPAFDQPGRSRFSAIARDLIGVPTLGLTVMLFSAVFDAMGMGYEWVTSSPVRVLGALALIALLVLTFVLVVNRLGGASKPPQP